MIGNEGVGSCAAKTAFAASGNAASELTNSRRLNSTFMRVSLTKSTWYSTPSVWGPSLNGIPGGHVKPPVRGAACGLGDRLERPGNDIDNTKMKVKSPQTNSICERFHNTGQKFLSGLCFRSTAASTGCSPPSMRLVTHDEICFLNKRQCLGATEWY